MRAEGLFGFSNDVDDGGPLVVGAVDRSGPALIVMFVYFDTSHKQVCLQARNWTPPRHNGASCSRCPGHQG